VGVSPISTGLSSEEEEIIPLSSIDEGSTPAVLCVSPSVLAVLISASKIS
jgi:hypothetical protein